MAKLALINREEKRAKLVAKFAKKRAALLEVINNANLSDEERFAARLGRDMGLQLAAAWRDADFDPDTREQLDHLIVQSQANDEGVARAALAEVDPAGGRLVDELARLRR